MAILSRPPPPAAGGGASPRIAAGLVFIYVIYGSSYVAFKVSFEAFPPLLASGAVFALAGLVLLVIRRRRRPQDLAVGGPELRSAVLLGFLMIGVGTGAVVLALDHLASGTVALIQATIPMWLAAGERLVFGVRLGRRTLGGLAIGFCGVGLLVGGGSDLPVVWVALVLIGSLAWASGILLAPILPVADDWLLAVALQLGIGGLMVCGLGVANGDIGAFDADATGIRAVVAWAYLLVVTALVGYNLLMWLVRTASPTLVGTANYVDPVVALFVGWAVLDEGLSARSALAAAVILAGVVLIVTSPRPSPAVAPIPPRT